VARHGGKHRRNINPPGGSKYKPQEWKTRRDLLEHQNGQPNDQKVQSLADAQARLLTKPIAANWRLQANIAELLSPAPRKKLDEVKRTRELAMR